MAEPGPQAQGVPASPPPPAEAGDRWAPQQQGQNAQPAPQAQQVVHLNWSFFKPEFSGKPEEDGEAHLLCTNNCMDALSLCRRC